MINVNGESMDWQDGMSVRDILKARKFLFPLLIIAINGSIVDAKAYDITIVPDEAEVKIIHLLSGG